MVPYDSKSPSRKLTHKQTAIEMEQIDFDQAGKSQEKKKQKSKISLAGLT